MFDDDILILNSSNIADVDHTDPLHVLAAMSAKMREGMESQFAHAKAMFEMGSVCSQRRFDKKSGQTMTVAEMAQSVGLTREELNKAMAVAKHFDHDSRLMRERWDEGEYKTWRVFYEDILRETGYLRAKRVDYSDVLASSWLKVREVIKMIDGDRHHDAYKSLERFRNHITRYIPLSGEIFDNNYLRYHDCCCCGATPEPEGFDLQQLPLRPYILFPVCEECTELSAPPDMGRILDMYAAYTINLEKTIDAIR